MKNVPNISCIHLLSGHLHGGEGRGGGRGAPTSWGDSSAGGWHVTAVTELEGGWAGDLLRPWSNYATRPPVRPSSLTPASLRTVLISCQEDQLPSLIIQHRWTFQPSRFNTPPPPHTHTHTPSDAAVRSCQLASGNIEFWHSGEAGERSEELFAK